LTRYSWDVPGDDGDAQTFSLTAGPLLITLDSGWVIGAASQPSSMSVTLWLEREGHGRGAGRTLDDPDLYPIEADDPRLSTPEMAALLRRRIESLTLLRREAVKAKWEALPREVGLVLHVEGGGELILGHGLHDQSDDFAVLLRRQILPALLPQLQEAQAP
jgi:hypothetical protein